MEQSAARGSGRTEMYRKKAAGANQLGEKLNTTCLVCERQVLAKQQKHCKVCLPKILRELREQIQDIAGRAGRVREGLASEIEKRDVSRRKRLQPTGVSSGAATLRDRCSKIRDQIFEGRIDAADLRFQQLEGQRRLEQAWMSLSQKHDEILENVLFPTERKLNNLLSETLSQLAMVRAQKVLEVVKLFQVESIIVAQHHLIL
eukprot:751640-Hanusia_phi.AAC.1